MNNDLDIAFRDYIESVASTRKKYEDTIMMSKPTEISMDIIDVETCERRIASIDAHMERMRTAATVPGIIKNLIDMFSK